MNTPAHAIFNLLILRPARDQEGHSHLVAPIALGAVLPDLPMVWFYFYQKVLVGAPEAYIWAEAYYDLSWQAVFDLFNSLPLLAAVAAIAFWLGARRLGFLAASMGLHSLSDLPLHHDDAHRHLYPLSDWRFESPISYWDPAHFGQWVALAEILMVLVGSVVLFRRYRGPLARGIIGTVLGMYVAYLAYVIVVWI